ncbi:hypothetical protein V498_01969 [Pseudogymnoascus sp. VKM F-4517 (FW-2822)]|nr:hypothetical protein V498_01969 [Pseudogymnoascus sp. VKM F-4517 (FW-2822)]
MRKTTQNTSQDNDGQPLRMTTRQTTAAGTTAGPSESPPDRIANLESEMRELKAMIATLPEYPAAPMRNTPGTVRLPPAGPTDACPHPSSVQSDPVPHPTQAGHHRRPGCRPGRHWELLQVRKAGPLLGQVPTQRHSKGNRLRRPRDRGILGRSRRTPIGCFSRGKRRGLGKGSFLGLRKCDLQDLDLQELLGGTQFLVDTTLSLNGLGVQTKALANTGANGYLVIDKPFAMRLSKALQSPIRKLPYSPDADRRDAALLHEDRRREGGRSLEVRVITANLEKKITETTPIPPLIEEAPPPIAHPKPVLSFALVEICEISANAFHYKMMRSDSEFFMTSIYEIDQILKERGELEEDAETLALIREKLPSMHCGYTDVFSKSESDRLPPH